MKPRMLTESDVVFSVTAEVDDLEIDGNAMASGDDELDRAENERIRHELDRGNVWAWAFVRVTASWDGFEGSSSLGACSYESEEAFRAPGGYFDDMKADALDALNARIQEQAEKLSSLA